MILCFSFDDGRGDAFEAYQILKKNNIKASFHLTTGFIDGTFTTDVFGNKRKPLSIDEIKLMHLDGMDISSHGDRHVTNSNDFITSVSKLSNWLSKTKKMGFSVPFSRVTSKELDDFYQQNKEQLTYIRIGRNKRCYSLLSKIHYFIYHYLAIRTQTSYDYFNKFNINYIIDKKHIYSSVITKDIKVKHLKRFISKHAKEKCVLVLMFHSIVSRATDKWEWEKSHFEDLCAFVGGLKEKGIIECKTLEEL